MINQNIEPNPNPPETFSDSMETVFVSILRGVTTSMGYQPKKIISFKQRWDEIDETVFFDVEFVEHSSTSGNIEIEIPMWQLIAFIFSSNDYQ